MTAALVTPPAIEPISLAEAKAHLRIDSTAEDDLVSALITAARVHVETDLRRVLIEQGWRIWLDRWPADHVVEIPVAPLQSIDAITVYDAAGLPTIVDTDAYEVDVESVPARIKMASAAANPERTFNGIEIDVTAGFGATSVDVPQPILQALLMLIAHWYAHRESVSGSNASRMPDGADALLAPYRVLRLERH